ncbi:glutamyl-tRNA synthetase 2 [Sphaeroforma arctica JP610]|uniref:glutamate--tRNA ligase n=1 Tax=Sphaeroforma arctica JP610 TaxID=667725 RepID=A0A0L0FYB3_9EUKA|nr:glutamyl-tRNA synthetase 2 [Sphaeroforma arctica JP610]KNC81827.1 glutamyl-tRNA synthetase 2 [Sphaeroforma arctica JP610]|eukprot:XP_014155729.1 glutamyl-tRNA synthetase 2 [Sphaeroforma arctica JP610]
MSLSSKPVVTRFAPSPTGYLHIGGARTAIFNWLYAKHCGGKMLLRIEDTDADRHNEGAVEAIIQGMKWLGLNHDSEITRQSARGDRHQEVGLDLVEKGKAYKCYCSKEKLDELRAEFQKAKKPFRYPGICRDLPKDYVHPDGVAPVIRLRSEATGDTQWDDLVQGNVCHQNETLDDLIILRSNLKPIYLLAVVVDDHDMDVTHVIRGSDHITNTARQLQIYRACGWEPPVFSHIPLIHGTDGKKLSKRHGATGLEEFESLGYLPEALFNYLARMSWSHGDDEIMTKEQMIEWFDIADCTKHAATMDFKNLEAMNGTYIRDYPTNDLVKIILKNCPELATIGEDRLREALPLLVPRAKTIPQFTTAGSFLYATRPLSFDKKAEKQLNDKGKDILRDLVAEIEGTSDYSEAGLETLIKAQAEAKELKLGNIAQPLRAALTGTTASPGIYEVMMILGKDEVVGRIRDVTN